jgi:hypothetical protein
MWAVEGIVDRSVWKTDCFYCVVEKALGRGSRDRNEAIIANPISLTHYPPLALPSPSRRIIAGLKGSGGAWIALYFVACIVVLLIALLSAGDNNLTADFFVVVSGILLLSGSLGMLTAVFKSR